MKLQLRISAYGILARDSQILLCRNRVNQRLLLAGGAIEFGEKATGTLNREFLEETGINIKVIKFLDFREWYFYFDPT